MKKLIIGLAISALFFGCAEAIDQTGIDDSSSDTTAEDQSSQEDDSSENQKESSEKEESSSSAKDDDSSEEEIESSSMAEPNESSSSSENEPESSSSESSSTESSSTESSSVESSSVESSSVESSSSANDEPTGEAFVIYNNSMSDGLDFGAYGGGVISEGNDGATFTLDEGQTIWFNKAGGKGFMDIGNTKTFKFTYSSDQEFTVKIMWGVEPDGHEVNGNPYWSSTSYTSGGFYIMENIESGDVVDFTKSFASMDEPVNTYFVGLGDPAAIADHAKIRQIVFTSEGDVTVNNVRFE